jgi:hypothetical protein
MLTVLGGVRVFVHSVGAPEDHMKIGREAGEEIRAEAGEKFFEELMEYVQDIQAANTKPTKVAK